MLLPLVSASQEVNHLTSGMVMENSSLCLLCDEEPFCSPTTSPRQATSGLIYPKSSYSPAPPIISSEDYDNFSHDLLRREHLYAPCHGYSKELHRSSYLPDARTRAIRYIILVCIRLNFAIGTAFSAVNYLDRFISLNYTVRFEDWMMELLSVACLSIASKMDEVSIRSVHDLQMEDLDHAFEAITIQQMELTVLKTLDWRLACVTPYSYVEVLTWGLDQVVRAPFITRMIELLFCALLDSRFLRFGPSNIAASALETIVASDGSVSVLALSIQAQNLISEGKECQKMMNELSQRTHSPNSVISLQISPQVLGVSSKLISPQVLGVSSKLHCCSSFLKVNPPRKKQKKEDKERYT